MGWSDSSLTCPKCDSQKIGVIDSRQINGRRTRRRACDQCGARWTMVEVPIEMEGCFEAALASLDALIMSMRHTRQLLEAVCQVPKAPPTVLDAPSRAGSQIAPDAPAPAAARQSRGGRSFNGMGDH